MKNRFNSNKNELARQVAILSDENSKVKAELAKLQQEIDSIIEQNNTSKAVLHLADSSENKSV